MNFDSPEWATSSSKMIERLRKLAQLISDERQLVSLIEAYRHQSTVLVTTGAVVDDDGSPRLLHEVKLDRQDALAVIVDTLKRHIADKRQTIERLLGELAS